MSPRKSYCFFANVGSLDERADRHRQGYNALVLLDVMATEDLIVEELDTKIQAEKMYRYIDKVLSEREKVIVKLRYGLGGKVPLTQREVAPKVTHLAVIRFDDRKKLAVSKSL